MGPCDMILVLKDGKGCMVCTLLKITLAWAAASCSFNLAAVNENITMLSYPPRSVLEVVAAAAESAEGKQTYTLAAPSVVNLNLT